MIEMKIFDTPVRIKLDVRFFASVIPIVVLVPLHRKESGS